MSVNLTQKSVAGLAPAARTRTVYDRTLTGFGVRITKSGHKAWIIEYRPGGGRRSHTRRITLGSVSSLPAADARRAAQAQLARVRLGADPAGEWAAYRAAQTVTELAEQFIQVEGPTWKPRSRSLFEFYLRKHINPRLGRKRARDVTHAELVRLHRTIGKGAPTTANRIVSFLRMLYNWAEKNAPADVPAGSNPARGIKRFTESGKERYLSDTELARLGKALREAETVGVAWNADANGPRAKHLAKEANRHEVLSPFATGAIRLLLFTGCRKSEILTLRWDRVDLQRGMFELPDESSKTGKRYVLLAATARVVLDDLHKIRIGDYVIAGDDPDRPRADLKRPWDAIRRRAGLEDVRLHDLRHSFASFGAGGNLGLLTIGRLLGHRQPATTQRYAHLADDPLRRANEMISRIIAGAMNELPERKDAEIVPLKRRK
jgi:integrase